MRNNTPQKISQDWSSGFGVMAKRGFGRAFEQFSEQFLGIFSTNFQKLFFRQSEASGIMLPQIVKLQLPQKPSQRENTVLWNFKCQSVGGFLSLFLYPNSYRVFQGTQKEYGGVTTLLKSEFLSKFTMKIIEKIKSCLGCGVQ